MSEAASDLPWSPGRLADGRFGRVLDLVVELLEPLPSDRGLEGVGDNPAPDRALAGKGHADKGVAPCFGGALAVSVGFARAFRRSAMVGAAFEGAGDPGVERVVSRFEGQHGAGLR